MNSRQRDLFLYLWSRRRTRGITQVGWRGAAIGAAGGFAFAWCILPGAAAQGGADKFTPLLQGGGLMLALVVGGAVVGWVKTRRIFAQQEMMYQRLLQSGAQVPEEKPALTLSDRWPLIAVIVTIVVIVGFIVVVAAMYL